MLTTDVKLLTVVLTKGAFGFVSFDYGIRNIIFTLDPFDSFCCTYVLIRIFYYCNLQVFKTKQYFEIIPIIAPHPKAQQKVIIHDALTLTS